MTRQAVRTARRNSRCRRSSRAVHALADPLADDRRQRADRDATTSASRSGLRASRYSGAGTSGNVAGGSFANSISPRAAGVITSSSRHIRSKYAWKLAQSGGTTRSLTP